MNDSENKNKWNWPELLKYPILIISVILGIILLDLFDYNLVSMGAEGINLERKVNTNLEGTTSLSQKIDSLELIIQKLSIQLNLRDDQKETDQKNQNIGTKKPLNSALVNPKLIASEITTRLEQNLTPPNENLTGWIWVGEYEQTWSQCTVNWPGKSDKLIGGPETLKVGNTIQLRNNVYLHDKMPPNDSLYYRAVKSVGIVPKGSYVEIVSSPILVTRQNTNQYWLCIKYEK